LDSDDEWHSQKLEKQVEYHKNNPDILISYTDELWVRDGKEVKVPKKFKKHGGHIFDRCLSHCIIAPSSVFVFRELLNEVQIPSQAGNDERKAGNDEREAGNDGASSSSSTLPSYSGLTRGSQIFDENLEVCEDYDLWLRISARYPIGLVNEKLIVKYAGHDDQLSFKHWGMDRFRVLALERFVLEIPSQAGNDEREAGNDDREAGNDEREAGNDEREAGNDEREAGNDDRETGNDLGEAVNDELIIKELIKKYTLLLRGAVKYDRIHDAKIYEKRLKELKNESN
jgi:hypothetical protein